MYTSISEYAMVSLCLTFDAQFEVSVFAEMSACPLVTKNLSNHLSRCHRDSVTRRWIKKSSPILSQELPKNRPQQFLFKSKVFIIAPKSPNNWAIFARKFFTKNFQKSPNLVALTGNDRSFYCTTATAL